MDVDLVVSLNCFMFSAVWDVASLRFHFLQYYYSVEFVNTRNREGNERGKSTRVYGQRNVQLLSYPGYLL